jgi:hypothetical protein
LSDRGYSLFSPPPSPTRAEKALNPGKEKPRAPRPGFRRLADSDAGDQKR